MTNETDIQRAEERRDLRQQIAGLKQEDAQQIIFKETSPRRVLRTIYSMRDGEPLPIPLYMAEKALDKRDPITGEYMFTSHQENAPEYKLGNVKCFLHAESPDQEILDQIGLSGMPCPKATLKNPHSKRMHALHRHPEEWLAYQDFLTEKKETKAEERQQQQIDATLALAEKASTVHGSDYLDMMASPQGQAVVEASAAKVSGSHDNIPATLACPHEGCDYLGTTQQLRGHKMGAHKVEAATVS